ncbi:MAG: dephospho-CoA kinase [Desulfobacterales bacterium]|nr:dephospho-CoA kinase [Desulfobacterales bacterium]MBS3754558.1 dephospho-CoA kinase [Desulfobacterales bacterium]
MNITDSRTGGCRRQLKIGVTGGVGSGKSLVCRRLQELGVSVCSADELARQAVEPGTRAYDQIVHHFGRQILTPDGGIDRAALRRIIVDDDTARKTLERLVHPEVMRQMEKHFAAAEKQGAPAAAAEVPLLFEAGLESFFDAVILVRGDMENRLQRVMARDNVSRQEAEALMKTQMSEAQKRKRADYVIENNGSISRMQGEVDRIYAELRAACKKKRK